MALRGLFFKNDFRSRGNGSNPFSRTPSSLCTYRFQSSEEPEEALGECGDREMLYGRCHFFLEMKIKREFFVVRLPLRTESPIKRNKTKSKE